MLFLPPLGLQQCRRRALLGFPAAVDHDDKSQLVYHNVETLTISNSMNVNSRGQVLVQVLIMGVLLLILVTLLIRGVTQHYSMGAFAIGSMSSTEYGQASIRAVNSAWILGPSPGQNCQSFVWSGTDDVTCSGGAPGSCNCTCVVKINNRTFPPYPSVLVTGPGGGPCRLQAQKNYP